MASVSFEDLEKRAARRIKGRNRSPYVLKVEGDDDIVIKYPDAVTSMEYEAATGIMEQLRILSGSEYPRLIDLFRGKDIAVVQLFITDMWETWNDDSHEVPGGKRGLIQLFDQYGRDLLLDFRDYWSGLDVIEYFSGERSWFEFYEFMNALPPHSRFKAKLALDPELAEQLHAQRKAAGETDEEIEDDNSEGWKPETRSQEGFTPIIAIMYSMLEAINEISRTTVAVNGGKPPQQQKLPRPFSALEMLELQDERDDMMDLGARFGMKQPD
ncbi:tail assembly chaperone [Gordonia phage IDyn]|uniref:Tail assembly chaperone n=1 Tax=Gordonia phage IDyn TaxID=2510506 RepID=A0A411CU23_9CAUD|nr:tail assembly chaperone [Gordonia phage IDyn]QAY17387.1 tail assembly chaperone [Gordonia phage IDyn]